MNLNRAICQESQRQGCLEAPSEPFKQLPTLTLKSLTSVMKGLTVLMRWPLTCKHLMSVGTGTLQGLQSALPPLWKTYSKEFGC